MIRGPEGGLSRAQQRSAWRVAGRLRVGGLVLVVGRCARRRRDFEVALIEAGIELSSGRLELDGDPWEQLVALARGGQTPAVSWSLGGGIEAFLGALNLGRERFGELAAGLLLWIGGLDAIECFPLLAPDLWAYRAGVEWVISVEDLGAMPGPNPLAEIAERGRYLAKYGNDHPRNIDTHAWMSDAYLELGDLDSAESHLESARESWMATKESSRPGHTCAVLMSELRLRLFLGQRSWVLDRLTELGWVEELAQPTRGVTFVEASMIGITILIDRGQYERADGILRGAAESFVGDVAQVRRSWLLRGQRALLQMRLGRAAEQPKLPDELARTMPEYMGRLHRSRLRPIEAVRAVLSTLEYLPHVESSRLSIPSLGQDLRSLGLGLDAHRVLDIVFGSAHFEGLRALELRAEQGRCLMLTSARELGRSELWTAFEGYASWVEGEWVRGVETASLGGLAAVSAVTLLLDDLIPQHPASEQGELLRRALTIVDAGLVHAEAGAQHDSVQTLRSLRARALLRFGRHDEAREGLEANLVWSTANEGPGQICACQLELAKLELARGAIPRALVEVERARRALEAASVEFQPRSGWQSLLLAHAQVLAAAGQIERARQLQADARERMAAAGALADELLILHALAEPFDGEVADGLEARAQAAATAQALAAAAGLVYEEARALANHALVHAERGRRGPAHKMLEEARWLADDHVHGDLREHVDRVGARVEALLRE